MKWIILAYSLALLVMIIKLVATSKKSEWQSGDIEQYLKELDASRDIIADLTKATEDLKYQRDFYLDAYKENERKLKELTGVSAYEEAGK